MLYTLGLYIVNVHWCMTSNAFSIISIFGIRFHAFWRRYSYFICLQGLIKILHIWVFVRSNTQKQIFFNERPNRVEYPLHAWAVSQALRRFIKLRRRISIPICSSEQKAIFPEWFPTWILGHLLLKSIRGNLSCKPLPPAMALPADLQSLLQRPLKGIEGRKHLRKWKRQQKAGALLQI